MSTDEPRTLNRPPRIDESEWKQAAVVPGKWAQDAACLGIDNPLMITSPSLLTRSAQIEIAQDLCGICPVNWECRQWAKTARHNHFEGIAGGLLFPDAARCAQRLPEGRSRVKDRWCARCQGYGKPHPTAREASKKTSDALG